MDVDSRRAKFRERICASFSSLVRLNKVESGLVNPDVLLSAVFSYSDTTKWCGFFQRSLIGLESLVLGLSAQVFEHY